MPSVASEMRSQRASGWHAGSGRTLNFSLEPAVLPEDKTVDPWGPLLNDKMTYAPEELESVCI